MNIRKIVKSDTIGKIYLYTAPKVDVEIELLNQYKHYIEKRINNMIVINSKYDPKQRASRAKPFKPALYIEV